MKTTMIAFLMLSLMTLSACNGGGDGASEQASPKAVPKSDGTPTLNPDQENPATEAINVTYYSLSRTEAPVSGWLNKTYTATGYCAEILEKTYCWSDGLKILQWTYNNFQYGPLKYNYFEAHTSGGRAQTCYGGCVDDYMESPKLITAQLLQVIPAEDIQNVFDHGDQNQMSCTLNETTMTCGSLVFTGVQ